MILPPKAILVSTLLAAALPAATLTWDSDGVSGAPTGGSGTWDATSAFWDNSGVMGTWSSANIASFGGTAGNVVVDASVTSAQQLQFSTTGYTLSGSALDLSAASNDAILVNPGVTATINNNLSKSAGEFWVKGGGTLVLGGTNTINPSLVITGGSTLEVSNLAALGGTGGLFFNGATAGNTFRYTGASASLTRLNAGFGLINASVSTLDVSNAAATLTLAQALANNGGASGLAKAGAGTLLMTGVNTFSGSVGISAGTLEIGGAGSLASGNYAGAISNAGVLRLNSTAGQTLSGVISGAGSVVKANTSTAILTGVNTYTGGTIISGGILSVTADSGLGAVPASFQAANITLGGGGFLTNMNHGFAAGFDLNLNANRGITLNGAGTLRVGYGKIMTVNGAISGTGSLNHTDGGTVILNGTNTFTGNLTNSVGTLALGGAGNTYTGYTHVTGSSSLRLDADNTLPNATDVLLYGGCTFNANGKTDTLGGVMVGSASDTTATLNLGPGGSTGTLTITDNSMPGGSPTNAGGSFHAKVSGFGTLQYATTGANNALWDILNTSNDFTGNWTVTKGRLRFVSGTAGADTAMGNAATGLTFNGDIVNTLNNGGGSASMQITNGGAGVNFINGAARTFTINSGKEGTFYVWGGTTQTVNGLITGGGNLRKEDGGNLLLNNTGNNWGGETKITSGTVTLGVAGVLPDTTLVRLGGGTLQVGAFTETVAGLSSVQTSDNAVLTGGNVEGAGTLVIAGSGTNEFGGRFNTGTLRLDGAGTQTLSGTTDNSGGKAIVNAGSLILAKASTASVHAIGATNIVGLAINSGTTARLAGTGDDQIYFRTDVQLNSGGTFDLSDRNEGFRFLLGSGTVTNSGSATSTLTLGEDSLVTDSQTFPGLVQNGSGTVALTKSGPGTLILSGTNTYSGGTTVSAGRLNVTGSLTASPVAISSGAFLGGEGSIANLTLGGGTLGFDASTPGALSVGTLTTVPGLTVSFDGFPADGSPSTVLTYTTYASGSLADFTLANSTNYRGATFADTGSAITVTPTFETLVWNGASGGEWDVNTSARWNALEADKFYWLDHVTFDDTGATTAITLAGELRPGSVTVDSSTNQYTFTGSAGNFLAGPGSLTKSGTSTLTLAGVANTFTGGTFISGGTVSIPLGGSLGTGGISLGAGTTLSLTGSGQTLTNPISNSGATFSTATLGAVTTSTVISGIISGTGDLTIASNGDMSATGGGNPSLGVRLTGANTFTGNLIVTSGLVAYASDAAFGNPANAIILNGGGLLDNNTNQTLSRNVQIGAGGGVLRFYGSTTASLTGALTGTGQVRRTDGGTFNLAGDLSGFTGEFVNQAATTQVIGTGTGNSAKWTLSAGTFRYQAGGSQTWSGVISGTATFMMDSGDLTLTGINTLSGGWNMLGGVLSVADASDTAFSNLGTSTANTNYVAVNNAATFRYTGAGSVSTAKYLWSDTGVGGTFDITSPTGSLTWSPSGGAVTKAFIKAGPGTFVFNGVISTTAEVTVNAGTLELGAANTHTGANTVNGGTLRLANALALGAGATTVATGGTLDLNGQTIANPVTIAAGGTLAGSGTLAAASGSVAGTVSPGQSSAATISFSNPGLTLAPTSVLALEIGGTAPGAYDVLSVNGPVTLAAGSTVTVTFIGGFTPSAGQTFDLIADDGGLTSAASLSLPSLPPGLEWNSDAFATTGEISVESSGPTLGAFNSSYFNAEDMGDPLISGTTADPDKDGVINALEYAFATNPWIAGRANLPVSNTVVDSGSSYVGCVYTRVKGATDLEFTVQFSDSPDSSGFTDAVAGVDYTLISTVDNGLTETITLRDNTPVTAGNRRFVRILVTYP